MNKPTPRQKSIQTVLGPIQPEQISICMAHEHFTVGGSTVASIGIRDYYLKNVVPQLQHMRREYGCNTIVECTCNDSWGRDVESYAMIARKTGIHIIASTGYYTVLRTPWWMKDASVEKLVKYWTKEARDGINGTGIRPGILKGSMDKVDQMPHLKPYSLLKKWKEALCRTHHETGLPITTHSPFDTLDDDLESFTQFGVPPAAIAFGHADCATIETSLSVLDRGAFLLHNFCRGFDTFFEPALSLIRNLVDRGYGDQILLSVDWSLAPLDIGQTLQEGNKPYHDPGNRSYQHLFTHAVPELKKIGVSCKDIRKMLCDNPRRHLAGPYVIVP